MILKRLLARFSHSGPVHLFSRPSKALQQRKCDRAASSIAFLRRISCCFSRQRNDTVGGTLWGSIYSDVEECSSTADVQPKSGTCDLFAQLFRKELPESRSRSSIPALAIWIVARGRTIALIVSMAIAVATAMSVAGTMSILVAVAPASIRLGSVRASDFTRGTGKLTGLPWIMGEGLVENVFLLAETQIGWRYERNI